MCLPALLACAVRGTETRSRLPLLLIYACMHVCMYVCMHLCIHDKHTTHARTVSRLHVPRPIATTHAFVEPVIEIIISYHSVHVPIFYIIDTHTHTHTHKTQKQIVYTSGLCLSPGGAGSAGLEVEPPIFSQAGRRKFAD